MLLALKDPMSDGGLLAFRRGIMVALWQTWRLSYDLNNKVASLLVRVYDYSNSDNSNATIQIFKHYDPNSDNSNLTNKIAKSAIENSRKVFRTFHIKCCLLFFLY